MNGEKNIGPVRGKDSEGHYDDSGITPINRDQIDFAKLQDACLENGKVKPGFTFEEFMNALMVKVNPEISTKSIVNPKTAISGAFSGQTGNLVIEAGATEASYSLTLTATEGTYTDGTAKTHKVTMGKVADEESQVAIGCEPGTATFNGDNDTNVKTVSVAMTTFEDGDEVTKDDKTLEVGSITITKPYAASSKELDTKDGHPLFCSSYGNALYTAVGQAIPTGNATATTNGKSVSIKTRFFCWSQGKAHLLNESYLNGGTIGTGAEGNVTVQMNDEFYVPEGYTMRIAWTTSKLDDSAPSATDMEITDVYVAMPSGASDNVASTPIYTTTQPSDTPWKKYKKYKWVSVTKPNNAKINITKNN